MDPPDFEILDAALNAVAEQTGLVLVRPKTGDMRGDRTFDTIVLLRTAGRQEQLKAEIVTVLNHTAMARLAARRGPDDPNHIIVTRHTTPAVAQALRDLGLQFMDVAGNAYLDLPPVYVFIQGSRLPKAWQTPPHTEGLLSKAGVKVTFALLRDPDLVTATYRDIAREARVALGTITLVFADLRRRGYLVDRGKEQRRLLAREELLDKWATAFAERLRPALLLGRYRVQDRQQLAAERHDWWQQADPVKFGAQWGGEVAAASLTDYLQPGIVTLYAERPVTQLLVAFKLVRDPQGGVEIRERFWREADAQTPDAIVHPILVYADLIATGDSRNIETARLVFDEHIRRYLRDD